jgi:glucokinase
MQRALAVDIGGSTTKIARITSDGAVEALSTIPTAGPADALIDAIGSRIGAHENDLAIGIAVAGFVDESRSAMVYNPNLAWLEGFPLRLALEEAAGRRVFLEADSNAACLGEYRFGAGQGVRRFLCVTIGTGVGAGMTVDGELVRVAHGGLGDMGHVMVRPFGPACGSGCHGCAEALISSSGIEHRDGGSRTAREIIDCAKAGEDRAMSVVTETGRLLGIALASYAVTFFPEVLAVAGGIAEAGELLLAPARQSLEESTGPFYRRNLRLRKAALGWQATLVGAAVPLIFRP